ncbi:protein stoned-A [Panulirus ornatus]|uniref:protein stoned-A n=1 Tax=Panulirus ornatus TaxID=150431 RepID=UPI003A89A674
MLKIKKGIKKKIKGKKEKDDELFTPEELEQYKREKEEEARRLAQQQQEKSEESEQLQRDTSAPPEEGAAGSSEAKESSATGGDNDWRNFFAATDTVLKKTSDNLVQIREASFFQRKEEKTVEAVKSATPAVPVVPTAGKKWVDLEAGGIDDENEVAEESQKKEPQQEPEPEPEPAPLQFIEDLPDVDVDEFTEVFDTTYVDNVESGQVKLHYIPDSPTTTDPNEPDPFDTSVVDKVLHTKETKPKASEEKKPEKKKKKLVNLGCAVEVLTGNVQGVDKPSSLPVNSKRRRVVQQEVNLLADFSDNGESVETGEVTEKEDNQKPEEGNVLEILCVENQDTELPEPGVIVSLTPRATSPIVSSTADEVRHDTDVIINNGCEGGNKEVDLSEFLESSGDDQDSKETKPDNGKDLDLKDLVAEFDIIDKSEVTNEALVAAEPDAIEDEFDAEFAFLAAESVAKAKEKETDELEDDPFDTSVASHVLGPEESVSTEKDPFDIGFAEEVLGEEKQKVKPAKPPPPRPAPPKREEEAPKEVDPFDTSIADKHLPVDPFALTEPDTSLSETLQPEPEKQLAKSESFDPFDTSIAESFGKTELKVLETELLTATEAEPKETLKKSESDFDFNPRAQEPNAAAPARPQPPVRPPPCLLTSADNEDTNAPVLAPSQDTQEEDFDPFDTSIAAIVEIKTLEAELLTQPDQLQQPGKQELAEPKKVPPPRPAPAQVQFLATTPTDTNPTLQPSTVVDQVPEDDNFDPFDTSIADNFGKTELKSLENELLSSRQETEVSTVPSEKPKSKVLDLPIKPLLPPTPKCLLATTPVDEQPTLQPEVGPKTESSDKEADDFDPFDTSIAEQFGKTELKVLESELLVVAASEKVEPEQDFDPRAETKAPARPPRPSRPSSPAKPQCLLTSSPARTPTQSELLVPSESKTVDLNEEFDPFDTSIANKFGKTELKHLESELLTAEGTSVTDDFADFDPREEETKKPEAPPKPPRPERPQPPAPCLLAATPTDSSAPLQPCINPAQGPEEGTTAEEFDPFDTSIADKLGRTEIKALEETLFTKKNEAVSGDTEGVATLSVTGDKTAFTAEHLLSLSPTPDLGPTLQPVSETKPEESVEFDPFDTSIADKFGRTELKTLESELLSDSGTKRNLSDDEFDPRGEENKVPKRPPPPGQKPVTPVSLLDSSDDPNIPDQPIQALQAQSKEAALDDYDPFDTSIAADITLTNTELKYIETELLSANQDPFDTSNVP